MMTYIDNLVIQEIPVGMYEIHGMKGRGEQHVLHNT